MDSGSSTSGGGAPANPVAPGPWRAAPEAPSMATVDDGTLHDLVSARRQHGLRAVASVLLMVVGSQVLLHGFIDIHARPLFALLLMYGVPMLTICSTLPLQRAHFAATCRQRGLSPSAIVAFNRAFAVACAGRPWPPPADDIVVAMRDAERAAMAP